MSSGDYVISIKDYILYNYICTSNARTSGGTSIAIANCIPQKELKLNTKLQTLAVQVTLHRPLTICSVYLPPNLTVTSDELESIVPQLPSPFLLLDSIPDEGRQIFKF
jgi:hypothetical protein